MRNVYVKILTRKCDVIQGLTAIVDLVKEGLRKLMSSGERVKLHTVPTKNPILRIQIKLVPDGTDAKCICTFWDSVVGVAK